MSDSDATPAQFLYELFSGVPDGALEITCLAPEGVALYPHTRVLWADLPLHIEDEAMTPLQTLNQRGYSIYFGATVRAAKKPAEQRVSEKTGKPYTFYPRGSEMDAKYVVALWVDIDDPSDAAYWRLAGMDAMPPIIVRTGGGWHGYFPLHEPLRVTAENKARIKRTLKGLALACGGDTQVAELARIMRLPGTINTKPGRGGALCEVAYFVPAHLHYDQLEMNYAPLVPQEPPRVTRRLNASAPGDLPNWIHDYLRYGAREGERNRTLFRAACRYREKGYSQMQAESDLTGRGLSDGLGSEEVKRTIASAYTTNAAPPARTSTDHKMSAADHLMRQKGQQS